MTARLRRIALAPNAFKGTLTAPQAVRCLERGLRRALPDAEFVRLPVADGGEGTADSIRAATAGRWIRCDVSDPLGRRIEAGFVLTGDGQTAVVEMAAASGLSLLTLAARDPLRTSTRGTGELVRAALNQDVSRLLIGVGGSATNDGGTGLARALGARFLDRRGRELPEGGGSLVRLARVDLSGLDPRLRSIRIEVACDVNNPLHGPRGAACVYAPQKGATPAMVRRLDAGLRRLAAVVQRDLGVDVARMPGAGAAGGLGAGLVAFLGGRIRSGAQLVLEAMQFPAKLARCDLVITGEGRLDAQTAFGKAPAAVAQAARRLGLPVIAICGSLGPDLRRRQFVGMTACISALESPVPETDLRRFAPGRLERCAEQVGRLLALRHPTAGRTNTAKFTKPETV